MRTRAVTAIRAGLQASDRRAWLIVFALFTPLYLLTAHYIHSSIDTQASVTPAWQLVHHGNVYLDGFHPRLTWAVSGGHHHLVSNRMPATILVNLPAAVLFWAAGPSLAIGAVTAALLSAATAATAFIVFRRLVSTRTAFAATAVLALGTGLWSVASTEVWTHTVDALCLTVAAYCLSRARPMLAGVAFGVAITARPQIAVVAAIIGVGLAWSNRSWRPVFAVGAPAAVGVAALVSWNHLMFGHFSLSGGYGSYASDNLVHANGGLFGTPDGGWQHSLAGYLFSPQRGLFVFTPIALVVVAGAWSAWRVSPLWVRLFALGGVAYSLVQLRINSFTGGDAFYGYRLAIELVVCAAPLAVIAHDTWTRARPGRLRAARVFATASIAIQVVGASLFEIPSSSGSDPWRASGLLDALRTHPAAGLVMLVSAAAACVWSARETRKPRTSRPGLPRTDPPGLPLGTGSLEATKVGTGGHGSGRRTPRDALGATVAAPGAFHQRYADISAYDG